MATSSPSDSLPVSQPYSTYKNLLATQGTKVHLQLDDYQKRWLVVGIGLHQVVVPALRPFVANSIEQIYDPLKQSLKQQTHAKHLDRYPAGKKEWLLKYQTINNNGAIKGKHPEQRYNYQISSAVDFARLFFEPHMAKFTAFDGTCDASVVLNLILRVQPTHAIPADDLRKIRNDWAHCNMTAWDVVKFQDAFQVMYQLIRGLQLSDGKYVLHHLTEWERNGYNLFTNTDVNEQLTKSLQEGVTLLKMHFANEGEIRKELDSMDQELKMSIAALTVNISENSMKINSLNEQVSSLEGLTTLHGQQLSNNSSKLASIEKRFDEHERDLSILNDNVTKRLGPQHSNTPDRASFGTPDRNRSFVGRLPELQSMCDYLHQNSCSFQEMAICGLGGCGKTSLAIEYAWLSQNMYPAGVLWISAESDESLLNSLVGIAIEAGLHQDEFSMNVNTALDKCCNWLKTLKQSWLMVVDNADDEKLSNTAMKLLKGPWRRSSMGHIVVTTRRESRDTSDLLALSEETCITLACLSVDDSAYFLTRRTCCTLCEDTISLAKILGGLPLALEQAALYIKANECGIKEYLDLYSREKILALEALQSSPNVIAEDRLSVHTTWNINFDYIDTQANKVGLKDTAALILGVFSFMNPDGIPISVINAGCPKIDSVDSAFILKKEMSDKKIVNVLSKFSLFEKKKSTELILTVHRMVQEVIQHRVNSKGSANWRFHLQCGQRMLLQSFRNNPRPNDVLSGRDTTHGCGILQTWSLVSQCATYLKGHIERYARETGDKSIFKSFECAAILYEVSIWQSLNLNQADAFQTQATKNEILANVDRSDDQEMRALNAIRIPVMASEQQSLRRLCTPISVWRDDLPQNIQSVDVDTWWKLGNEAFHQQQYVKAIHLYTQTIIAMESIEQPDAKVFTNRSHAFFLSKNFACALTDANKAIKLDPSFWKGYCWRAYAIAELHNENPESEEHTFFQGLSSASVASYMHPEFLRYSRTRLYYPLLHFHVVSDTRSLMVLLLRNYLFKAWTPILLKANTYEIPAFAMFKRCLVGIEEGVCCVLHGRLDSVVHMENVRVLPRSAGVVIASCVCCTFYRCTFSCGERACQDFPCCKGGEGCQNDSDLSCEQIAIERGERCLDQNVQFVSGSPGYPGAQVIEGGRATFETCSFIACGGGGFLAHGEGSVATVVDCVVSQNRGMGLEAREGGVLNALGNTVSKNNTHGITIGPNAGRCVLKNNLIFGHHQEGMITLQSDFECMSNIIRRNGRCGLSIDGGHGILSENKISKNWAWGIIVKSRSSVMITGNEIFGNSCGAIRLGINYSASCFVDQNIIYHNGGPAFHMEGQFPNSSKLVSKMGSVSKTITIDKFDICDDLKHLVGVPNGELEVYTKELIVSGSNTVEQNDQLEVHPHRERSPLFPECSYCGKRNTSLQKCGRCRKVSYCGKECQLSHFADHKILCRMQGEYSITIDIPRNKDNWNRAGCVRTFNYQLKGIGKGRLPPRKSKRKFIVKIQDMEYAGVGANSKLTLYDQTTKLDFQFVEPRLVQIIRECGVLSTNQLTSKKIYCYVCFSNGGRSLCIDTEQLAPIQEW